MQQTPGVPAAPVWQNPQAAPLYPSTEYAAPAAMHSQGSTGQVPAWDPNLQARSTYASVPGTFPVQTYPASSASTYAVAARPAGSSPLSQPSLASMRMSQMGAQPNVRLGGFPVPGQPPYYRQ